jgi:hypothetical protein
MEKCIQMDHFTISKTVAAQCDNLQLKAATSGVACQSLAFGFSRAAGAGE